MFDKKCAKFLCGRQRSAGEKIFGKTKGFLAKIPFREFRNAGGKINLRSKKIKLHQKFLGNFSAKILESLKEFESGNFFGNRNYLLFGCLLGGFIQPSSHLGISESSHVVWSLTSENFGFFGPDKRHSLL